MICRKSSGFSPSGTVEVPAVGGVDGDGSAAGCWGDVGFCCSSVALIALFVDPGVVDDWPASAFGLGCRVEAPFSVSSFRLFLMREVLKAVSG